MSKPVAILGISALYHDSAAALVVDGRIIRFRMARRYPKRPAFTSSPSPGSNPPGTSDKDLASIGNSRKMCKLRLGCKSFQLFRPPLHDHDLFGDGILIILDHQKAAAVGSDVIV